VYIYDLSDQTIKHHSKLPIKTYFTQHEVLCYNNTLYAVDWNEKVISYSIEKETGKIEKEDITKDEVIVEKKEIVKDAVIVEKKEI